MKTFKVIIELKTGDNGEEGLQTDIQSGDITIKEFIELGLQAQRTLENGIIDALEKAEVE